MSKDLMDLSWEEMTKGLPVPTNPVNKSTTNQLFGLSSSGQPTERLNKSEPDIDHQLTIDDEMVDTRKNKPKKQTEYLAATNEQYQSGIHQLQVQAKVNDLHEEQGNNSPCLFIPEILQPTRNNAAQHISLSAYNYENPLPCSKSEAAETEAPAATSRVSEITTTAKSLFDQEIVAHCTIDEPSDTYAKINKTRKKVVNSEENQGATLSKLPNRDETVDNKLSAMKSKLSEVNNILSNMTKQHFVLPTTDSKTTSGLSLSKDQQLDSSLAELDTRNQKIEAMYSNSESFDVKSTSHVHQTEDHIRPESSHLKRPLPPLPSLPTSSVMYPDKHFLSHNDQNISTKTSSTSNRFCLNDILDVYVHATDINKLHVDVRVELSNETLNTQNNETLVKHAEQDSYPCKYVIHSAEPRWWSLQKPDLSLLTLTYDDMWLSAGKLDVDSVAVPIITDSFDFPPEQVSKILCDTIITKGQVSCANGGFPKEIHVVGDSSGLRHVVATFRTAHMPHIVEPMTELAVQNELKHVCIGWNDNRDPGHIEPDRQSDLSADTFEPRSFRVGLYTTVVLHTTDIIQMAVDAIVSGDSPQLEHIEGVSKRIADAAGPAMSTFCREIIENQLTVGVSEVVQTPPGELPCKLVFHTVGPIWSSQNHPRDVASCLIQLKRTFDNIFDQARLTGISSIAIPPISTGSSNVPIVHVAEKLYRAIVDNEIRHKTAVGSLREIHIVDTVPDVLIMLVHLLQHGYNEHNTTNIRIIGADDQTEHRIATSLTPPKHTELQLNENVQSTIDVYQTIIPTPLSNSQSSRQSQNASSQETIGDLYMNTYQQAALPQSDSVRFTSHVSQPISFGEPVGYTIHDHNLNTEVHIFLYLSDIASVKADAIVNPTDGRLKHHHGISQVISLAAGPVLKDECQKLIKMTKIPVSGVVHTGAGNLPCNVVLHAVPPKWPGGNNALEHNIEANKCLQKLTTTLENIFLKAIELGSVRTIALPTICSAKAPIPIHYLTEALFHFLIKEHNIRLFREIHIVENKQESLGFLKARFDSAVRSRIPDLLVARFAGDIGQILGRVVDSGKTQLYAEIPAYSPATHQTMLKKKSKLSKLTGRFTKFVTIKKPKDINDNKNVTLPPGSSCSAPPNTYMG